MNQLLESYKKRMTIAERYYAQRHDGAKLSQDKKMVTAVCLNNINKYLTESYRNSVGVQATDVSMLRQFAMDVTNLVMPNLIAHELVLVKPMEGRNTVLYYREYALN